PCSRSARSPSGWWTGVSWARSARWCGGHAWRGRRPRSRPIDEATRGSLRGLEHGGVAEGPVRARGVERLQSPVTEGPAPPERPVAVVDLRHEVSDWPPAEVAGHLRPHVEVDPG